MTHDFTVLCYENWTDMTAPPCEQFTTFWQEYQKRLLGSPGVGRKTGTNNLFAIRKSVRSPGAMTLVRRTLKNDGHWVLTARAPVYAKRSSEDGSVTFESEEEANEHGLEKAIDLIEKIEKGVTTLMAMSDEKRDVHKQKDSYAMLASTEKSIRDQWPDTKRCNEQGIRDAVELFYTYNGRGLTCVEHLEPLMLKILKGYVTRNTDEVTWTYVQSNEGVVSGSNMYFSRLPPN